MNKFNTPFRRLLFLGLSVVLLYFWKQPELIQNQARSAHRNSDFISSFLGFPFKVQWFLIIEGLIILTWFVSGIVTSINSMKLNLFLRENNYSRWAELHDQNGNVNFSYHAFIWGSQDNENEFISHMKTKIRWGFILIFSPLILTGLNLLLFICVFHM